MSLRSKGKLGILLLAGAVLMTGPALAQKERSNAAEINRIIKGLSPAGGSAYGRPGYRDRILRIEIPYGYHRDGHASGYRTLYINYNHSLDLSVYFAYDSTRITRRAQRDLDELGYALQSPELRDAVYLLAGHTDAAGPRGYNQWLSEQRARAVKYYLVDQFNIHPSRLITAGFGEERLRDRHNPRAAVNRRVEVALVERNYSYEPADSFRLPTSDYTPPKDYRDSYPESAKGYEPPYASVPADYARRCEDLGIKDPRPANTNLDDYGGRRTAVGCAIGYGVEKARPAKRQDGAPAAADDAGTNQNDVINQ